MFCEEHTCFNTNVSLGETFTLQCGGQDVLKSFDVSFDPRKTQCDGTKNMDPSAFASVAKLCATATIVRVCAPACVSMYIYMHFPAV